MENPGKELKLSEQPELEQLNQLSGKILTLLANMRFKEGVDQGGQFSEEFRQLTDRIEKAMEK